MKLKTTAAAAVLAALATRPGQAQLTIDWYTIDGGGASECTDGQPGGLDLAGTTGQHDAGVLTGGSFELAGGFWFGATTSATGACCRSGACEAGTAAECASFVCNVGDLQPTSFLGCYADADGNGIVNAGDRGFVSANIGQTADVLVCLYDMDGNGVVNAGDRGFVSANVGLCAVLPDWQNGSGLNGGVPDARFDSATFMGAGTTCGTVTCP